MIQDLRRLVDEYAVWVRGTSEVRALDGEYAEITTPFLDRHNDFIQIYAKREGAEGYRLTDGGDLLSSLRTEGVDILGSERRAVLLSTVLNGFGVKRSGEELFVTTGTADFPQRKHNFVQAVLAVNDMFMLASPIVTSVFYEDVARWLQRNEVRFVPHVKITGRSGLDHQFDFAIPSSASAPERLVRAINHPRLDTAKLLAFSWVDTKEQRDDHAQFFAILNDQERASMPQVASALQEYGIIPVPWSQRAEFSTRLNG